MMDKALVQSISTLAPPGRVESHPVAATAALADQYFSTIENYQPLYGITEVIPPLRHCRDRATAIEAALPLRTNGLRLIDFGSSLGYFPFYFSDRGGVATGWDINPKNIKMSLACQQLNGLPATFDATPLSLESAQGIAPNTYDVALILSVLHHIGHQNGLDYVQALMKTLLERIPVLVLELAHREEGVQYPWRMSLPKDPLAILATCPAFHVTRLGDFPSHLSDSTRPLFLVERDA